MTRGERIVRMGPRLAGSSRLRPLRNPLPYSSYDWEQYMWPDFEDPNYLEDSMLGLSQLAVSEAQRYELQAPGWVYFIASPSYEAVKIGFASNLLHRLSSLRTASPAPLFVAHAIVAEHGKETEAAMHLRFSSKRVRGEWFKLDREDLKWAERQTCALGLSRSDITLYPDMSLRIYCCGEPHFLHNCAECPDDDFVRQSEDNNRWYDFRRIVRTTGEFPTAVAEELLA